MAFSTTETSDQAWYNLRDTASGAEYTHPSGNGWYIANVGRSKQGTNAWSDMAESRTGMLHIAADDVVVPDSVSSLGNTRITSYGAGYSSHYLTKLASQSTIGANSDGYELSAVTVDIRRAGGNPGDLTVAIYSDSGNKPNSSVTTTLSGSNPTGAGQFTFTCSSSCTLSANTKYHLMLDAPNAPSAGNNAYWWDDSSSGGEVTSLSGNGWSIGESFDQRSGSSWFELTAYFKYMVSATGSRRGAQQAGKEGKGGSCGCPPFRCCRNRGWV